MVFLARRVAICTLIALTSLPAFAQQSPTRTRIFATSPAPAGLPLTLTAEVDAPDGGKPTGRVSFTDGASISGSAAVGILGAGQATLATGIGHSCALVSPAGMKCWGRNDSGQLGNGSQTDTNIPTEVIGLLQRPVAMAVGARHTCALTIGGAVECWGSNGYYQLGETDTRGSRSTPAPVPSLSSGVIAIASGLLHSCAVTASGGVMCWGQNLYGQLGDGKDGEYFVPPTLVGGPANVYTSVAAGAWHSCGLTKAGAVLCWGRGFGVLPTPVAGVESGVVAVTAGDDYSCALTRAGAVKCWELDLFGPAAAVQVPGLETGVVAIAAGHLHRCALILDGGVRCWGWNGYGQLGDGTTVDRATPTLVGGLGGFAVAISAGWDHSCAVLSPSRTLRCWGFNDAGMIGDGTTVERHFPASAVHLSGILRGRAQLTTATLAAGWHSLRANYLGDPAHATSTTAPLPLQIK